MMNQFKYRWVGPLLLSVSLGSFADDNWHNKEVSMQCGAAKVQVSAECQTDPEDNDSSICRNTRLNITQGSQHFSALLPYMPSEQKEKLEEQNYTFSNLMSVTDWAPQTMHCLQDKYILISYWNGMNDAETLDGSLSGGVSAPIFDFSGHFVNQNELKKLSIAALKDQKQDVDIGFVYSE